MGVMQGLAEKASCIASTRRNFLKSAAAVGALASIYGYSEDGYGAVTTGCSDYSDDVNYTKSPVYRYGTSCHDCGGRCIIKAQVSPDGRIVRFLTDDINFAYDGTAINGEDKNCTQARACARCRSYRGRLYHPGRLKYPLKQTKERGDLTGFVRISWKEALSDIANRLHAVQNKYGATAVHSIAAAGNEASAFQGAGYGVFGGSSKAMALLGGGTYGTSNYSYHQAAYMGRNSLPYTGMLDMPPTTNSLSAYNTDLVLWGTNISVTNNPKAYAWVRSIEEMKARDNKNKVTFIGPELSEIGISKADEWIQIKPYTDVALVCGMLYYMLDKTLKAMQSGAYKKGGAYLDFDYIDTMVYGFFDSPAYWVNKKTGDISMKDPKNPDYTFVAEVPAGRSFSAYIMGDDDRLTKIKYGSSNYVAAAFTSSKSSLTRNKKTASYKVASSSLYAYKKDINRAKTVAWASNITGVDPKAIEALAELYLAGGADKKRIWNEWSGGMLKQNEGCSTFYAIQSLLIITKNWGKLGTGLTNSGVVVQKTTDPAEIKASDLTPATWGKGDKMPFHPAPSGIQWRSAVKFAFGKELAANGYKPNIYDWADYKGENGEVYYDDGGVKALVSRKYLKPVPDGKLSSSETFTKDEKVVMPDGSKRTVTHTYFNYDKNGSTPIFSGFRFILNSGGNCAINQHANTIDSARMYQALPTYGYAHGKHNVSDMADAFYLVSFDNFMSVSAIYSDYVLPAKTTWEQEDFVSTANAGSLYIDSVIKGPGEAMSTWDFARELIKAYAGNEKAREFTGLTENSSFKDVVMKAYNDKIKTNAKSPFYNKTWDEFLAQPISHAKPKTEAVKDSTHEKRAAYDTYSKTGMQSPFCPNIATVDSLTTAGAWNAGGNGFAETESCPAQSGRFHVYSGSLVWRFENLYSKWHGYLDKAHQGQSNKDSEGDAVVYPIPMYFNYEDYFRVAYGLKDNSALNGRYLLTTTHERFRTHSSHAENPFLRELTHRTEHGALYSGNDYKSYAVASSDGTSGDFVETNIDGGGKVIGFGDGSVKYPHLNALIGENGLPLKGAEKKASYADIWVNADDFAGFKDGDLVKVSNEIGAVICAVRKTDRCVSGYVDLHEGCLFDPRGDVNSKDVIDVGACCNTLMSATPSRIDHGNGTQSACVKIEKFNGK